MGQRGVMGKGGGQKAGGEFPRVVAHSPIVTHPWLIRACD